MTNLTLQRLPVADPAVVTDQVYFVLQRANGHWNPAAKVINVFATKQIAEAYAVEQKTAHPQQHYGVASLRSEARPVQNPIEIVQIGEE